MQIKKAVKQQLKMRLALTGPSGSGKTYTALSIATAMGGRIGVIDSERSSASRYADEFDFDVIELEHFSPDSYMKALRLFDAAGYENIIIDSLTHAWNAEGGILDIANGKFSGWKDATPAHNALVSAILSSKAHVITTMRSKTEYQVDTDDKTKRQTVKKLGTAPIQKDGVEYEFDIVGDLDWSHTMSISKTRCRVIDGKVFRNPGAEFAGVVAAWLNTGDVAPVFDPEGPRKMIRQLPGCTPDDSIEAGKLTTQEDLRALYVKVQKQPKFEETK